MQPLTPTTPHVVIMVGIPGAGKSAFAEHFAKTFQAPLVSYEKVNAITDNPESSRQIIAIMLDELTKTNRTIVYDGPSGAKTERLALTKTLADAGYKPLFVWVQTESIEARRRATRRRQGSTMSNEDFDQAVRRFTVPAANEKMVVISGKHTYTSQLKIVLKHLAATRPDAQPPAARPQTSRPIIMR